VHKLGRAANKTFAHKLIPSRAFFICVCAYSALMSDATLLVTLIASGFGVGALVGLTGVGGGSLMTPLLISVLHVKAIVAIGTDLLFAAITKSSGAWVHAQRGNVEWRLTLLLCAGSVPATLATLAWLSQRSANGTDVATLSRPALGVALIFTAVAVALRPKLLAWIQRKDRARAVSPWRTVLIGAILGGVVSLTSVGAGALGVTALLLLYPLLPFPRIVGSDIAHAVPLTFVAGAGHMAMGNVDFALLGGLLVGSLPGIYVGSKLSSRVPEAGLRALLCVLLLIAAFKMFSIR
jgi:uncharacterized protein